MLVLNRIYTFKEIIVLLVMLIISATLFFNNQITVVDDVKADFTDLMAVISKPKEYYQDLLVIREENKLLKEDLLRMQLMNARLIHYKKENEDLKEMLQFSEESPLSIKPCSVVDLNLTSSVQTVVVDIGNEDGMEPDLPVLDMNGLIGKVISVGDNASSVQLLTDKNYRVSVRVGEDRTLGIFSPTHGNFGILAGIQESLHIKPGDIAYTSGISDIYPPDIPVAQVLTTRKNSESGFQDVSVEIMANIFALNYVFVIQ